MPANLENSAWPQDWKRSVFIPLPKKGNAKECSNCHTIALISHASKVMLKILQARLQQYMNHELPDVQAGFRKGRGTRDQIANIRWIIKKAREFQKNIYFSFIDYAKAFDCVDHNKLWKVLQEMEIPDHLTHLLRNLYAGQEATVRTGHGPTDWFQIGKGVRQGYILSPCLFNLMQSTSWEMLGWRKHRLESRLPGEISQIFRWYHPYGRKWRRTKELLDESERGEWKGWLKAQHSENYDHGIQSHHFMANRSGRTGNSDRLYFGGALRSLQMVVAAMKLRDAYCLEERLWPAWTAY